MFGPTPENSPEILSLSTDAQVVLAAQWALGLGSTLTMQNQASRFSPRAAAAVRELVEAGIILDEKADDGFAESRTYRLSGKGRGLEFRKSMKWISEHGKFNISEKIT